MWLFAIATMLKYLSMFNTCIIVIAVVVGLHIVREGQGNGCCRTTVPAVLQYPRVLFMGWIVAAARAAGALETPAAGLRPRPAREK